MTFVVRNSFKQAVNSFKIFAKLITILRMLGKNMVQSVADDDLFCTDQAVVARNLLKVNLLQSNIWRFAFDQDLRLRFFCDEKVDTFGCAVQFQLLFQDQ